MGSVAVLVTWIRIMSKTSVGNLKTTRLKLQKQVRDAELQVFAESQLRDGKQGAVIPGGLVVGEGLGMYANIWENEFRDGVRYGEFFEWVAPWQKLGPSIKPHLTQGDHILQVCEAHT